MKALKYSRQRESIKACLMNRHDHPTADALYASIREEFPNISLGTVYRNLSLLVELGEIAKISTGNSPDRFDCNTKPHSHFICTHCHCIQDVENNEFDCMVKKVAANIDGRITDQTTTFYGLCNDCLNEKELLKSS